MVLGLAVVLTAATASADITITLDVDESVGCIAVDSFFDVFVEVDTDVGLAMVQVVMEGLDPSVVLTGVTSPPASLAFINAPDTAVADYYPNVEPDPVPGSFTAMVLTFQATQAGTFALDLALIDQSSFSTAVFDASYIPTWALTVVGDSVTVVGVGECIPEPFTMSLLALVGLGGVIASRKK